MTEQNTNTIIFFFPEKQTPPRKGMLFLGKARLNPGRNTYKAEEYKLLEDHPSYQRLIDLGAVEVIATTEAKKDEETEIIISNLNVRQAEKIIVRELDKKQLEKWQDQETKIKGRETVLNAIARQINTINLGEL